MRLVNELDAIKNKTHKTGGKKMKRKVAGVLAAAMAAGMLAGCGSSAKPADTTAAKAEDTKAAEGSTEAAA